MKNTDGKLHKKRILILLTALLIAASGAFSLVSYGDEEVDAIRSKLSETKSQIEEVKKEINSKKSEKTALSKKINAIDQSIASAETAIDKLQDEIGDTKKKVDRAQEALDAKELQVADQDEAMGLRIRNMYKNGETSILEILLGSQSLTDLMTNLDMAARIMDNDLDLLAELETQYQTLKEYREELKTLQSSYEDQIRTQKELQDELEDSRGELENTKASVEQDLKLLEAQEDAMNAEANALTSEILRLQSDAAYAGGAMIWPVPASTRITSPFGYRMHPILKVNKLHTGIDIGVGTGNQVLAANDGTVIKAAWNNSYGYMVMIDHGGGIVTLYAHNSKLLVKEGDVVTRGQQISKSGSTGMSTGPHVHFEVRLNGVYQDPLADEYVGLYASYKQ